MNPSFFSKITLTFLLAVSFAVAGPLHDAAKAGNLAEVKRLVENGADLNAKDDLFGNTALHLAAGEDHLEVVRYLVEAGADLNAKTKAGYTALHLAAGGDHLEMVRYLVEAGADLNAKDNKYGETALHAAATPGHLEVVKVLVEAGADPHAKENSGFKPIDLTKKFAVKKFLREAMQQQKSPITTEPK